MDDSDRMSKLGPTAIQVVCSLVAIGLLGVSLLVPFWSMKLEAPQYPAGLRLTAYGNEIVGDLREINIINHYVGMEHIDTVPAPEMALFSYGVFAVMLLCLLAPLHRRLAQVAVVACVGMPIVILVDLQWWLHSFGRNLDPGAPLDIEPFTPLALGISKIHNFVSKAWVSWGFFCMLGAAVAVGIGLRLASRKRRAQKQGLSGSLSEPPVDPDPGDTGTNSRSRSAVIVSLLALSGAATTPSAMPMAPRAPTPGAGVAGPVARLTELIPGGRRTTLQERVDAAPPGSRLEVEGGRFRGPIVLDKPIELVGIGWPVIDGEGQGSVVTISGSGVTLRGFSVRNSGRAVTQEAAGVKVSGSGHLIAGNVVEDVYFGIHLSDGARNRVIGNRIAPGHHHGARPGHAISLWHQRDVQILDNHVSAARDGIYLTFADDVHAENNLITGSRYGVHSMYSENSTFERNTLNGNLLGTALMYSNGLQMRCNRIVGHREGATAYGVLLKDIDDLVVERNLIAANRVGIYADNTPLGPGHQAIVRGSALVGNDAALALQSTVALTFYENVVADNLTDVRAEGAGLSSANSWSVDGRGNYWDQYQGYDEDGDGIGDIPYRYESVMNEMLRRAPLTRAFVHTPASQALEQAARLFPLYKPGPLLVDERPVMWMEADTCWASAPAAPPDSWTPSPAGSGSAVGDQGSAP